MILRIIILYNVLKTPKDRLAIRNTKYCKAYLLISANSEFFNLKWVELLDAAITLDEHLYQIQKYEYNMPYMGQLYIIQRRKRQCNA